MTITQQELERYLWGAANLLRGLIDPSDYKSIIFPLMFFKRLSDVYDEEYQEALITYGDTESAEFSENHMFQIPDGSHWKDVRAFTSNLGQSIRNAMQNIEKANPQKLSGIFGDTNWTNKDRLSDRVLTDLIEHFSLINLGLSNVTQDEFGNAYEYLIKKFADDSGHSAAEFYTNRTVVRLMTLLVDPKPGESIYDPTCGSGGMLLNARLIIKEREKEYRTLKLYGQEINIITSSIARMNMFIHGVQDFEIVQGDTLKHPAFIEKDGIRKFDICLANPPYSMKKWNRESWKNDPWGRNIYGTSPQGCADYAFIQHIICSLNEKQGRCAILLPHGILFRDSEKEMRKKLIESDYIEAIIGLGRNLFYNSSMESCILVCNKKKDVNKQKKILFINASSDLVDEKNFSYLSEKNITKIFSAFQSYKNISNFSRIVNIENVIQNNSSLNINRYLTRIRTEFSNNQRSLPQIVSQYEESFDDLKQQFEEMKNKLASVGL
ncbi:MAG: type I restriction-modification system subunit M [archaeon]